MKIVYILLILLLSLHNLQANQREEDSRALHKKMKEEARIALVIGNNNYQNLSILKNPINDAKAIKKALQKRGFQVIYKENATKRDMKKLVKTFTHKLSMGGVGIYYFAGHGINVGGYNYLVGVDSLIDEEEEVEYETLSLNYITTKIKNAHNRLNIIVLDACRNNPFGRGAGGGLAPISNAKGIYVAYATEAGSVASDGKNGKNGLFTKHLIKSMNKEGANLNTVFKSTRKAVYEESNGKQSPGVYDQTLGEFFFTLPHDAMPQQANAKRKKESTYSFNDESPSTFSLTINPTPSSAKVSITNIKKDYYDGIRLKPAKYNIKVTHKNYYTKNGTLSLRSNLNIPITLKKKEVYNTKILKDGVRFNVVQGNKEYAFNKFINNDINKIGYELTDPHERINDGYKERYGNTNLDNLGFFTISEDAGLRKLLLKVPELGIFSPFNLLIYKKKNENKTYIGHVMPSTMLDIIDVKDRKVRNDFISLFKKLDNRVDNKIGGKVKIKKYTSLPNNPMMKFELLFNRPHNLVDFIDDFQEKFEIIFEKNGYIILGYKNFAETYAERKENFPRYDAYFVYQICHFKFSELIFNQGRPDTGVFASCGVYMYIEKGSNKLHIGIAKVENWISVMGIKDLKKINQIHKIDIEILKLMNQLGAKSIH